MTTDLPLLHAQPTSADSLQNFAFDWSVDDHESQPLVYADGMLVPPALATTVCAFWNEKFLFVRMAGHFRRLRMMHPPAPEDLRTKTRGLWNQSDVYEAFLGVGARSSGQYFEFQFAPDGRWNDLAINAADPFMADENWVSGVCCRSETDAGRGIWRALIQIPWRVFGGVPGILEGNFYRASGAFHGDELLAWSPTGYGERCFHRPQRFGKIVPAARPASEPRDA